MLDLNFTFIRFTNFGQSPGRFKLVITWYGDYEEFLNLNGTKTKYTKKIRQISSPNFSIRGRSKPGTSIKDSGFTRTEQEQREVPGPVWID